MALGGFGGTLRLSRAARVEETGGARRGCSCLPPSILFGALGGTLWLCRVPKSIWNHRKPPRHLQRPAGKCLAWLAGGETEAHPWLSPVAEGLEPLPAAGLSTSSRAWTAHPPRACAPCSCALGPCGSHCSPCFTSCDRWERQAHFQGDGQLPKWLPAPLSPVSPRLPHTAPGPVPVPVTSREVGEEG